MKKYALLMLLFSFLISCNDRENRSNDEADDFSENTELERNSSESTERENQNSIDSDRTGEIEETETTIKGDKTGDFGAETSIQKLEGKYKKTSGDGTSQGCACSCFEISFSGTTELCVAPNNIYISAKFTKTGPDSAEVFLVEPLRVQNVEREIPWNDFDKNIPVATIKMMPNGEMKMDWIGFSIGGELAVDYAIYGKKALEGTYKKE
ncbi:MAG TPA: hypothetical protein VFM59_01920 [Salinimicrobium sp.]|nr:hypothetical protein [Salinimicrobium sp.]